MAKAQKFGTFGGVFVPSVLTILGVIMYLRLGWVVGEAGLIGAIVIILVAHVISVTTGLSVSSVSTDKKVKAGGIYYILSRSLGLPIGGSIGVALFVATSLSIAMYIVGFGESFNNAIGLTGPEMDAPTRVNYLRVTGTITLMAITTIALVSTSLAIKAQYYILGAIGLSLISVFAGGLFMDHGLTAQSVKMLPSTNSVSMEVVFAIFFPAVTGFTAGVAMSGDLKDSKKSIPIGTMAAIGVGLVIYIGLAIFLGTNIDSEAMVNDTNILSRIALFAAYGAPFLMAGIWGATLSSALGGILGGPRILQAMSLDKVTPKLFGKGVGKSNEPRNALIFTFLIAEIGILIGELDLIAPIVSMFYLTAYGFINLTSALQSWSGSDFRPSFKIPRVVSVIGAVATFAVMFKLDALAMIASFIVIGLIFFFLTKKQINLGFSDIWQGVWSEIVRTALFKIESEKVDKRNWRPNIILFSGGTDKRPHLMEYGKKLVGKLGLLSNFDLIEDKDSNVLFTKDEQSISVPDSKGVFMRRYHCSDIYDGISRIAETYGFSGLEPNTVVIGWARYSQSPEKFAGLINVFKQLDYNLLIMDYDPRVGFGTKKLIDIWWQGEGRHVSFALTISRFLNSSEDWQEADIRLIILAETSEADHMVIDQKMQQVLEELRISAEIKIINTALDHRTYYEIIQRESAKADLIYLELPELSSENKQEFFEKTDALCHEIGTVVLYRASKYFEDINLGLGSSLKVQNEMDVAITEPIQSELLPELIFPKQPKLAHSIQNLDKLTKKIISEYFNDSLSPALSKSTHLINSMAHLVEATYQDLIVEPYSKNLPEKMAALQLKTEQLLEGFRNNELLSQEQTMIAGYEKLFNRIDVALKRSTPYLQSEYGLQTVLHNGRGTLRQFSWWQKALNRVTKRPLKYQVNFKKVVALQLQQTLQNAVEEVIKSINKESVQFISRWQKQSNKVFDVLHSWQDQSTASLSADDVVSERQMLRDSFGAWITESNKHLSGYKDYLLTINHKHLQEIATAFEKININNLLNQQLRSAKTWKLTRQHISEGIAAWKNNQLLFFNIPLLELKLSTVREQIASELQLLIGHLDDWLQEGTPKKIEILIPYFEKLREEIIEGKSPSVNASFHPDKFPIYQGRVEDLIVRLKELPVQLPEQFEVANFQEAESNSLEEVESISISPAGVVNYHIQNELAAPLLENTEKLKTALEKTTQVVQDVIRVISYSVNNLEVDTQTEGIDYREPVIKSIDEEIERLRDEHVSFNQILSDQEGALQEKGKELLPKLEAFAVIKSAVDLDYLLRTQQKTEAINKFSKLTKGVKERFQNSITNLYYRKSEGLLAAERFRNQEKSSQVRTEDILRLVEATTPLAPVIEKLPFYYKQLFLKDHAVGKELWLIRKRDLLETKNAIADYKKLNSGAILIIGEPGSGKTFLSDFVARNYSNSNKIYYINPPVSGSIDIKLFVQSVKKALHFYGDIELAFKNLEEEAAIIFNDIELWWERSENGSEVIQAITDIIDRYGSKCLIIANMNKFSFDLVNSIKRIDDSFIRIMQLQPFSAEELKEVITKRHQTSRLKFLLDGIDEDGFNEFKKAKLFNQYFNISKGNVGVALQNWISNIRQVKDGLIEIRWPDQPNGDLLHHLEKDRLVLVLQFLLHHRLDRDRLQRIMGEDPVQLNKEILVLLRSGVLAERNQILELNRFLRPILIDVLEEDSLI